MRHNARRTGRTAAAIALALAAMCGCANEDPDLLGHTAKVTGLVACAGTTEAANTMERNGMSTALGFSSAGETLRRNSHEFRASRGVFLQSGWRIRFVGHEDYGGNDFTKVHVESVPKYQERYRGSSCWLATPGVRTLADAGDLKLNL